MGTGGYAGRRECLTQYLVDVREDCPKIAVSAGELVHVTHARLKSYSKLYTYIYIFKYLDINIYLEKCRCIYSNEQNK